MPYSRPEPETLTPLSQTVTQLTKCASKKRRTFYARKTIRLERARKTKPKIENPENENEINEIKCDKNEKAK